MSRFIHLTVLAAALTSCNENEFLIFETTDTFNQNPWEKVDILLVVDNSCSMEPYQDKLATDFGAFFRYFEDGEVDWQIAVVHTDVTDNDFGRIRGPIITPESIEPEEQFADVVHVGTTGNGLELGLESAARALRGLNPGFPREDSSISVIFVSDEQDGSTKSVSEYADDFYSIRGERARDAFNASALTVTEPADCTPEQYAESSPGTRYIEIARLTGGLTANLCVADFESIVTDLALTTSAMRDTFYLTNRPNLDTLEVSIGDVIVGCDEGVWHYAMVDADGFDRPAIVFEFEHIPAANTPIVAKYQNGSGLPAEGYCRETDAVETE